VRTFFMTLAFTLIALALLRKRRSTCAVCRTEGVLPGYRLCGRCIAESRWP
jgi:hypothetical protein